MEEALIGGVGGCRGRVGLLGRKGGRGARWAIEATLVLNGLKISGERPKNRFG